MNGDTSGMTDEYPTLRCGALADNVTTEMDGPQAYYKFAATKDQWYRIALTPQFLAYLYVFSSTTCGEAEIGKDCTSGGATGETSTYVGSGKTGIVHFVAPSSDTFHIAVDKQTDVDYGTFRLTVEEK